MAVDLRGRTVVCIASGPSLTDADCALVEASGVPAIAVNNSWQIARFAAILYAGDDRWWDIHHAAIDIGAERWTCAVRAAHTYQLQLHKIRGPYNSGLRAIQLAQELGARRAILLGYDCQYAGERRHWHGDHVCPLGNAGSVRKWLGQFTEASRVLTIEIVNASRASALTCWPRVALEAALAGRDARAEVA